MIRSEQTDSQSPTLGRYPRTDWRSRSLRGDVPFCLGIEILKPVVNMKLHDESSMTYVVVVSVRTGASGRDPMLLMASNTIPFSTLTFGTLAELLNYQAVRDVLMSMCSVSDPRR
jgi:hypothetical protein